jgi:hypothetical protein
MAENAYSRLPQEFAKFLGIVPNPIVKPGEGGSIGSSDITNNDVLCGRGAYFDKHPGNMQFRKIAAENQKKMDYNTSKKIEKTFCGAKVVAIVRNLIPSGRFLSKNNDTGYWVEVGDVKARKKAVQALRDELRYGTNSAKKRNNKKKTLPPSAIQSEKEAERGSNFLPIESLDSANDYSELSDSSKESMDNVNVSDSSTDFNMDEEDYDVAGESQCENTEDLEEKQDFKVTIERPSEDNGQGLLVEDPNNYKITTSILDVQSEREDTTSLDLGEEDMISSDDSEFADFSKRVRKIIYSSGFEPDDGGSRVSERTTASESLGSQLSFDLLGLSRARIIDPRLHYNYENLAIYTSGYCVCHEA